MKKQNIQTKQIIKLHATFYVTEMNGYYACHYIQEDCAVFTKAVTLHRRFCNLVEMFLRVLGQHTLSLTFLQDNQLLREMCASDQNGDPPDTSGVNVRWTTISRQVFYSMWLSCKTRNMKTERLISFYKTRGKDFSAIISP